MVAAVGFQEKKPPKISARIIAEEAKNKTKTK